MSSPLQLGQKVCFPSSHTSIGGAQGVLQVACFKIPLHLWISWSLLGQDATDLGPKQESCQEFRQPVPLPLSLS